MKNAEIKENIKRRTPEKKDVQDHIHSLQQQVKHFKKEKDFILALSGDITGLGERMIYQNFFVKA
jgi:cell division septum initiation protein DivIVA